MSEYRIVWRCTLERVLPTGTTIFGEDRIVGRGATAEEAYAALREVVGQRQTDADALARLVHDHPHAA